MRLIPALMRLLLLGLLIAGGLLLYFHARAHPEDLPWTPLDLADPVGAFTGRKLAGLADDEAQCQALLSRAGVRYTVLPALSAGPQCGYPAAIRLREAGALDLAWRPAGLGVRCPVAAGLALWEWHVVQPAALEHLSQEVAAVEHYGSYSCRRIGPDRGWSEHATANAVDIAAFRLADGSRVSVIGDWAGETPEARFLRAVRDGACDLFATVLSPDFNAAHRDHLHFDQAARGEMSWRACR